MRIAFITLLLLQTLVIKSQSNTYLEDLAVLKSYVENTASYKAQIKGDNRSNYNELYKRLSLDTVSNLQSFKYFYNLSQLLFPLRDNHLVFYQLPNYDYFKSKESIDSFVTTKEFGDYPNYNINLDSLKTALFAKPVESIEGIYHYDKYYKVGLFKSGEKEYIGVVLDSELNLWVKGQVAIYLFEFGSNLYKAIYGHPLHKNFIYQPIEKYRNQTLVNSYFYGSYSQSIYTKQLRETDYVNLSRGQSKFAFKNVNEDVQYILIQSFQKSKVTAQSSQQFYDTIKTILKAPYLILDLRNNEGGAYSEMKKYFMLLKKYVKNGQLFVLVNNGTLSQAEIFTLKLKQLKNVTVLGQQTKGMLSYGSNYGRRKRLPSGKFELYPTDMNNGAVLLPYEDVGIKPDVLLTGDKDWIEQVVEIIRK